MLGFCIISILILAKYRLGYEVSINGKEIGVIENKEKFEEAIKEMYLGENSSIEFFTLDQTPTYEVKLISNSQEEEEALLSEIKNEATPTYLQYAITIGGENVAYVSTMEEAQGVIENIEEEEKEKVEVGILKVYTNTLENISQSELEVASTVKTMVKQQVEEQEKKEASSVNGVYIAMNPIEGTITSRFGDTSGRTRTHSGLDIAATTGTPIKACSDGTVKFSGYKGSYGNVVIVDNGNGVETYYAHCSKLYVEVGQEIKVGDVIGAVGSTGNSTGPHLHLEIRVNGTSINPQKYVYGK